MSLSYLADRALCGARDRRGRERGGIDFEFAAEGNARGGAGDRADRTADRIAGRAGREFARCRFGSVHQTLRESVGAEFGAHGATYRARNALGDQSFHFFAGESAALALRHLQQAGTGVDTGALCDTDDRGFGESPGGDLLDQPFDGLPDGEPGGDLGGRFLRGRHRCADSGAGGGDRLDHLDREYHQGRDDHVLRMLDIGGGIAEVLAQALGLFDEARPQPLLARDLIPELLDRVVGLAVHGGEGGIGDRTRVRLDLGQRLGELIPSVREPPHRGLIALRPVTRADNVFRHPLQFGGDFDTHGRCRSEFGLSDRPGIGLILLLQGLGGRRHIARHTREDGAEIAAGGDGFPRGVDVALGELLADLVRPPAFALGLDDLLQALHGRDHPVRDVVVLRFGRPQCGGIDLERAHRLSPWRYPRLR
ncbi:hypothetical protein [Nocardia spumae]|uniref:hypothetical protein n=1 Tax=Nocardia spumae TaxID=2887190 RepID=UPI001D13CE27|nr:hypothetical protein [Nocardia spumae]